MSVLTNHKISKIHLDSWTAESREPWRFPLEYLAAFESAAETYAMTKLVAEVRGCRVLVGLESLKATLGELEMQRDDAARKIRELKRVMMGGGAS